MILTIDTSDMKQVLVSLKKGGQVVDQLSEENEFGSQVLLPMIEKILKKNKLKYSDLKKIELNTGPGSYTGLRVGAAVANSLGFSLGIPVNGKKIETQLQY